MDGAGLGLLAGFPAGSLVTPFTVANGRIAAIDLIVDPDKLRGLPAPQAELLDEAHSEGPAHQLHRHLTPCLTIRPGRAHRVRE